MCSVVGCKTALEAGFRLPEDPERRLEWVQFLTETNGQNLSELSLTDMCICSDHFTEDCFENLTQMGCGASILLLKSTATPSLHPLLSQPEVNVACATSEDEATDIGYHCDEHVEMCKYSTTCPDESALLSKGVQANPVSCGVSVSCSTDVSYPVSTERSQKQQGHLDKDDIIKQKFVLLQKQGKFIVNERCLLQLFRRNCPSCGCSCKLEKIVCGPLVTMHQQCINCEYKFQWKSQTQETESTPQSHQEELRQAAPSRYGSLLSMAPVIISELLVFSDEEHDTSSEKRGGDYHGVGAMDSSSGVNEYNPSEPLDFGGSFHIHKEIPQDDLRSRHKPELCPDCGMFSKGLKPHTCEHKVKPYSCNVCGKRCRSRRTLRRHSRIHEESYTHPCRFCLETFKTKFDKRKHEDSHPPAPRPYKCPDCPEAFTQLRVRNRHLRGHRGVKKYACRYCKFEFYFKTQLHRHERLHTGVKPFVCEVRRRFFNQERHLRCHRRLHTGGRPYKCPHCDKSFKHSVSRKRHVRRYHGEARPASGPGQLVVDTTENEDKSGTGDAEEGGGNETIIDTEFSLALDEEEEEAGFSLALDEEEEEAGFSLALDEEEEEAGFSLALDEEEEEVKEDDGHNEDEEEEERSSKEKTAVSRATGRPTVRPSRGRRRKQLSVSLAVEAGAPSHNTRSCKHKRLRLKKT